MSDAEDWININIPEMICKFCKGKIHYMEIRFSEPCWGLESPMHMKCAIEALIDRKIAAHEEREHDQTLL